MDRRAEPAFFNDLTELADRGIEPLDVPDGEAQALRLGAREELARLREGAGDRLLDEQVFAERDALARRLEMQGRRRRDDAGIERGRVELRELLDERNGPELGRRAGLWIDDGDHLEPRRVSHDAELRLAHSPVANNYNAYRLHRIVKLLPSPRRSTSGLRSRVVPRSSSGRRESGCRIVRSRGFTKRFFGGSPGAVAGARPVPEAASLHSFLRARRGRVRASMSADWDLDFSHDLLLRLVRQVEGNHRFELLGDAPRALGAGDAVAFVRHDVDVSLSHARDMALVEREWNVRTTYHVMSRSPFYDLASTTSRAELAEIARAGHEIGLHFFASEEQLKFEAPELEAAIDVECMQLEDLLGAPVRSLSFHLPPAAVLKGPLLLGRRVNAYAADLLGWYLSDSRGRWREGDPRESLTKPRSKVLQLLVHPIWWGKSHAPPDERLGGFVQQIAERTGRSFEDVAETAWEHIIFRAKKPDGAP